ncbi:MAG: NAD(P)H-dependent oxidoreductase [Pseudomonadota bacterium]
MTIKILALCGSTRYDSLNQKLLQVAALGARECGAQLTMLSLRDFPLPIYDADAEKETGVQEPVRALQRLLAAHDALLIASPEHNGGYTALLKNTLDWISRPTADGQPGVLLFSGRAAAIVSASPGPTGGLRSMLALRGVLEKLGAVVIPQQFTLGAAHLAFSPQGALVDPSADAQVRAVGAALAGMAQRLAVK